MHSSGSVAAPRQRQQSAKSSYSKPSIKIETIQRTVLSVARVVGRLHPLVKDPIIDARY